MEISCHDLFLDIDWVKKITYCTIGYTELESGSQRRRVWRSSGYRPTACQPTELCLDAH